MQSGIPAGDFSAWLEQIRAALRGDGGSSVPCGDCVGCCTSSWFIPIRPNETATLALIPPSAVSKTPRQPSGMRLMGYQPNGHCPMFHDGGCSIYLHRPQTCKDFDCRVFTAAGVEAGGDDKAAINRRVRAWAFAYPGESDRQAAAAVQRAARFLQEHAGEFPPEFAPRSPAAIAVLAVKSYAVFLRDDAAPLDPASIARAVIDVCREFDQPER
jgi:Fe-S-cluster containining protein